MCGLSAILDRAAAPDVVPALLALHAPIRHRGPDGEGFLVCDGQSLVTSQHASRMPRRGVLAGFAFRRLKVLDLSDAAGQPMLSPDRRFALVFNGEIYNFRELRRELTAGGRSFRTRGDAEVVLAAYEAWGTNCFGRLDGMWALALLDLPRRRLVASRDRFGIKSMHWASCGSRLLIASEAKQLLSAQNQAPRPHARTLARYLRGSRFPCLEDTFFENVRAVPPATWFEVPLDGGAIEAPRFHPFWNLADFYCQGPESAHLVYETALVSVQRTLTAAIESHREADVTVGSLLSGGLDSSLLTSLAAAAARAHGVELPTFAVGTGDGGALDELPFARSLVDQDRLTHHTARLEPAWFAANAPAAIRAMEEPPSGMAALAQYRAFELARTHGATVVLDGQGADEVFGGYPGHQRLLVRNRLQTGHVLGAFRELRAMAAAQGRAFLPFSAQYLWTGIARRFTYAFDYLEPAIGMEPDPAERAAALDFGRDPSPLNRELYHAVRWGNIRVVLPYSDKNAMAHSIEARVPYLDRALVELAFSLPDCFKVGKGQRKRLLHDLGRQRLPQAITERTERSGFAIEEPAWLRRELWPAVREVTGSGLLRSALFRAGRAERLLDDFAAARHDDFRSVWRLFALGVWADQFSVRLP